jgi:hypothetical protein
VPKWLAFVANQVGAIGRDLVAGKQYSCVSASTWTRGDLVPTDTTG